MTIHKGLRILFVEDEDSFLLSNSMYLANAGFDVDSVKTGAEALELLSQKTYDTILLDYVLPDISGLNVLQWMHEQKMDTPVIMLTGRGSEELAVEVMKFGAYDYIRKETHEMHHLPILIQGVHERHLFRKEKEAGLRGHGGKDPDQIAAEMFLGAIATLAHILNNALSLLSLSVEEQTRSLLPAVKEEERGRFSAMCDTITRQYALISKGVQSLLILSKAFQEGIEGGKAPETSRSIQESLESMEKEFKKIHGEDQEES